MLVKLSCVVLRRTKKSSFQLYLPPQPELQTVCRVGFRKDGYLVGPLNYVPNHEREYRKPAREGRTEYSGFTG